MGAIIGVAGLLGSAISGSQQAQPQPPSMFDTPEEDITGFNQQETVDEESEYYEDGEDYDDGSITGYDE